MLLVHPGGPFWRDRDLEAWSLPKGEYDAGEEPETAALREFAEELCVPPQAAAPGEASKGGKRRRLCRRRRSDVSAVEAIRSSWNGRHGAGAT